MPSGHTDRKTLTPYRRALLKRLPTPARELSNPARRQLNDCLLFGWVVEADGVYSLTAAGAHALATPT